MQATPFYRDIPLWVLYIFSVAVVLLSTEAGYQVGRLRSRRSAKEKDAPVGGLVGATLGLLAFLLAFTFSAAASRFETRKQLVLLESNAIGTAYLRTDFLPEPERKEARDVLFAYAKLRAQGVTSLLRPEAFAESSALGERLWNTAVAVGTKSPSPVTSLFIQSVNEVIDLDAERIVAGRNRIPESIWGGLLALTVISMAAMGYQFGLSGARSWGETILLVLVFTLVILLIADLDRPQSGLIQVSQQPMLDLLDKLRSAAP